jgi:hypothetical protein
LQCTIAQFKIFSGVPGAQDISLPGYGHMCIDFCDFDGTVSKHFLDVADVHVGFQQAGGKGVAEHMRRDVHVNVCQGAVFADHPLNGLVREGSVVLAGKKWPQESIISQSEIPCTSLKKDVN